MKPRESDEKALLPSPLLPADMNPRSFNVYERLVMYSGDMIGYPSIRVVERDSEIAPPDDFIAH